MSTNSYGAPPYEGPTPQPVRSVRWDLLFAVALDLAIWAALIGAGVGIARLFN